MIGRLIKGNIVILILVLSITAFASAQWEVSTSEDIMTGTETWYATSPFVNPVSKMKFPYGDTKAWLGIGHDGESEWVYIGFTNAPNLNDTTIKDGYNLIETRIKWDNDLEDVTLTQRWGSQFIHFRNYAEAIAKIGKSNTLLIELDWYGQGKVHFRFPLAGSADAIEEMRAAFK